MNELLLLLAGPLGFLLEPGRFRIVDSRTGERLGDADVTLASSHLRMQLVCDRSELSIRVQPSATPQEWFWLGVVRRVVDGDRPGSDRLDDRAIEFLRGHVDDLDRRCAEAATREALLGDLRSARSTRATELFGGPPM